MSPFALLGAFSLAIFKSFALAGGGGSGGGGGGGGGFSGGYGAGGTSGPVSDVVSFLFLIGSAAFCIAVCIYMVKGYIKNKKMYLNFGAYIRGEMKEEYYDEKQKLAKETFIRYQHDWSAFDVDAMKSYMTDSYYRHNLLMMGALKLAARQNQVDDIQVRRVLIKKSHLETFTADLHVIAKDITNDTRTNQALFTQDVNTEQFYRFQKLEDKWLLDGVDTITADSSQSVRAMQQLADDNGYFYSLDWGWLLLPNSGQLFKNGKFGISDINNHIIGTIGQTIFQLYTYRPYSQKSNKNQYLVAQVAVPREYGNIYVRPNKLIDIPPNGMTKVSLEWGDFNKKYDVFATDMERVTSFELLNPSFMEKLEALPFHMSIEVADNVVYLYSTDSKLGVSDYRAMIDILKEAFKEMRM